MQDGRVSSQVRDLAGWIDELGIAHVLVAGDPEDELVEYLEGLTSEVRFTQDRPAARSVAGQLIACRAYHGGGPWVALINPKGPVGPDRGWRWSDLPDDDPLSDAWSVYTSFWSRSSPLRGRARFSTNDVVRTEDGSRIGRVAGSRRVGESFEYTVIIDGARQTLPERSLALVESDPSDPAFWLTQHPADAQTVARTLTWTKLRQPLTDVIYSFGSSRTLFRPYQFRPVLKIIESDKRRLLIADEVGLGKTIEAGLVWNELEQRADVRSALVVCPSTLRFKWQRELQLRFDRKLPVLDRAALRQWVDDVEQERGEDFQGIVSLELLRSADRELERLTSLSPRLDLVIVDEAHYMRNADTRSYELGQALAEWADALLFLSATPLNLHQQDLFNLLNLLDGETFPNPQLLQEQVMPNRLINTAARLLMSEREKPRLALAELSKVKESVWGAVIATSPDFLALSRSLDVDRPLTYQETALARRALMELHTLAPVFTRTRKVDTPESKAVREPRDIVVAWSEQEQAAYEAILAAVSSRAQRAGQPLGFVTQMPLRQAASCLPVAVHRLLQGVTSDWTDEEESDLLEPGLELSSEAGLRRPLLVDSKYRQFLQALREGLTRGSGQALVFSFFKGTLEYLRDHLATDAPDVAVGLMYGPTPPAEREALMQDFRLGKIQVLLCSEVGAEGLDFQFCNVLFNYDLPWNPMRVEQRIGRLDRFGQTSDKIFIFNMQVPGTIETDILTRLYQRIQVFEQTIGDLEPILRDLESELERALDPRLTAEQRRQQMDRVAVALEARQADVQDLENADGLINGIGDLLVEGFTEDGPGRGRYLGKSELLALVRHFVTHVGGSVRPVAGNPGRWLVRGDQALVSMLRRQGRRARSSISPATVAARLDDAGLEVTLAEPDAIAGQVDLLTPTHPLVVAAVEHLGEDPLRLRRFGAVTVPGLDLREPALAGVYLITELGLRPSLTLLCIAVGRDGVTLDDVSGPLLSALAEHRLSTPTQVPALDVERLHHRVEDERARRLLERDLAGKVTNEGLVDRRIAARRREFELKIDRAEQTLRTVVAAGRDDRVRRLNAGRVRNLKQRRDEVIAELDAKRGFSVSSEPVAFLLLVP